MKNLPGPPDHSLYIYLPDCLHSASMVAVHLCTSCTFCMLNWTTLLSDCLVTCSCTRVSELLPVQKTFQWLNACFAASLYTQTLSRYICLYICLFTSLSVCQPIQLVFCLWHLMTVCLSVCLFTCFVSLRELSKEKTSAVQPAYSRESTSLSQQHGPRGFKMSEHSGPMWP